MAQTIIPETNNHGLTPEFQRWSRTAAWAEEATDSLQEAARWQRAEELWAEHMAARLGAPVTEEQTQ